MFDKGLVKNEVIAEFYLYLERSVALLQEIQQQVQELQQTTEDSSELQEEVQRLQQQNQVLDRYICSTFGKPARKVQAVFGGAQVLVASFLCSCGVFAVEAVFKNGIVCAATCF